MALFHKKPKVTGAAAEEARYMETQWQLMWRKFRKHKLAMIGMVLLIILYTLGIFCEFFATQDMAKRSTSAISMPPTKIHFVDENGNFSLRPFVYGLKQEEDPVTWKKYYVEDTSKKHYLQFFYHGDSYKLLGFIPGDIHLFGTPEPDVFFPFGTDSSGRCLYSRVLSALRISLSTGLVDVFFTFILGCIFGGISGYYGGKVDTVIQRIVEFLMSMPSIPLWMALAAAFPITWSVPAEIFYDYYNIVHDWVDRAGPCGSREASGTSERGFCYGSEGFRRVGWIHNPETSSSFFCQLSDR